jgi:hypothetical protein
VFESCRAESLRVSSLDQPGLMKPFFFFFSFWEINIILVIEFTVQKKINIILVIELTVQKTKKKIIFDTPVSVLFFKIIYLFIFFNLTSFSEQP